MAAPLSNNKRLQWAGKRGSPPPFKGSQPLWVIREMRVPKIKRKVVISTG